MQQDNYNMPGIVDVRYLNPGDVPAQIMSSYVAGIPV